MTSLWCLYCQVWTDFRDCFEISIANFERVSASWVTSYVQCEKITNHVSLCYETKSAYSVLNSVPKRQILCL